MASVSHERAVAGVDKRGSHGQRLSVRGLSVQEEPTVNPRQINRGYRLAHQSDAASAVARCGPACGDAASLSQRYAFG